MGATTSTSKEVNGKWLSVSAREMFDQEFLKTEAVKLLPPESTNREAIQVITLPINPEIDPKEFSDLFLATETNEPLMSDIISIFRGIYSENNGNPTSEFSWQLRKQAIQAVQDSILNKISEYREEMKGTSSSGEAAAVSYQFKWVKQLTGSYNAPTIECVMSASSLAASINASIGSSNALTLKRTYNSTLRVFSCSLPPASPLALKKLKGTKKKGKKKVFSNIIEESPHPYLDSQDSYKVIEVPGAVSYALVFDNLTVTEMNCDYLRFYVDDSHTAFYGENTYTGGRPGSSRNYPGTDGRPPLVINASRFIIYFHSDYSSNDWGYKITITPSDSSLDGIAFREVNPLQHPFPSPEAWNVPENAQESGFEFTNSNREVERKNSSVSTVTANLLGPRSSFAVQILKLQSSQSFLTLGLSKKNIPPPPPPSTEETEGNSSTTANNNVGVWGIVDDLSNDKSLTYAAAQGTKVSNCGIKIQANDTFQCVVDSAQGWAEMSIFRKEEKVTSSKWNFRFEIPVGEEYVFSAGLPENCSLTISPNEMNETNLLSPFALLQPLTPMWFALEDIQTMVQEHLQQSSSSSSSSSSQENGKEDLEDTEVTFLFALAIMRNSLFGVLDTVMGLLAPNCSFNLTRLAKPFCAYFFGNHDLTEEYFVESDSKKQAVDLIKALELLSEEELTFPVTSSRDSHRLIDLIEKLIHSTDAAEQVVCASLMRILGNNIRRVVDLNRIPLKFERVILKNPQRLKGLLDSVINDTSRDPSSDPICQAAVILYENAINILIPNTEHQFDLVVAACNASDGQISAGQNTLVSLILEKMNPENILEKVQNMPVQGLLTTLQKMAENLSIKIIQERITDPENSTLLTLNRMSGFLENLVKFSIVNEFSKVTDEQSQQEANSFLLNTTQSLLSSGQRILESAEMNDEVHGILVTSLSNTFISTLVPYAAYSLNLFLQSDFNSTSTRFFTSEKLSELIRFMRGPTIAVSRAELVEKTIQREKGTGFENGFLQEDLLMKSNYFQLMRQQNLSGNTWTQTGPENDPVFHLTHHLITGQSNALVHEYNFRQTAGFHCSFDWFVNQEARADAIYFYHGFDHVPLHEDELGYILSFDVFPGNPGGAGRTGPGIYLRNSKGDFVASSELNSSLYGKWNHVEIEFNSSFHQTWKIKLNGQVIITFNDNTLGNWLLSNGLNWGIGARTGGETANFQVRRLEMTVLKDQSKSWLQNLSSDLLYLQLQSLSTLLHPATEDASLKTSALLLSEQWLASPLFSRGLISENEMNESVNQFLRTLVTNPEADPRCKVLLDLMRKKVISDRVRGDATINKAVHSSCAALIWHHGLGPEALALAEERRTEPSKLFLQIWTLAAQEMRAFFNGKGDFLRALSKANGDSQDTESALPYPGASEEVIQNFVTKVVANCEVLLQCQISSKQTAVEESGKKLWKSAAKLAVLQESPRDTTQSFAAATTKKGLKDSFLFKNLLKRQAKTKKTRSLGENIMIFISLGPSADDIRSLAARRSTIAESRASGIATAIEIFDSQLDVEGKLKVLSNICTPPSKVSHFLKGLTGARKELHAQVAQEWFNFTASIVRNSLEWLNSSDESTSIGRINISAVLAAVAVLSIDYSPSDAKLLKESQFLSLLFAMSQSSVMNLRGVATRFAESLIHRCCTLDQKSRDASSASSDATVQDIESSLLVDKELQADVTNANTLILPTLLNVLSHQLKRSADSSLHDSSRSTVYPQEIAGNPVKWLTQNTTLVIGPTEPSHVVSDKYTTMSHSFAVWVWRPKGVQNGVIMTNAGPSVDASPWSTIVLALRDGLPTLEIADAFGPDHFKFSTPEPLPENKWTHVAFTVSSETKQIRFFVNGVNVASRELGEYLSNRSKKLEIVNHVVETTHNYADNMNEWWTVQIPNATKYVVKCDPQSHTEQNCDYLQFFKGTGRAEKIGLDRYTGYSFPGIGDTAELEVEDAAFELNFYSDGSCNYWGFKANIQAYVFSEVSSEEVSVLEKSPLNNFPIYLGQPSGGIKHEVARVALSNACLVSADLDSEQIALLLEQKPEGGAGCLDPSFFSLHETFSTLSVFSRVAKALQRDFGATGVDRLLSHDVVPTLLGLTFKASSPSVRFSASKVASLLLPNTSLVAADNLFFKHAFQSQSSHVGSGFLFSFALQRLGELLNPLIPFSSTSSLLSGVEASQIRFLIESLFDATPAEWETRLASDLESLLINASVTLDELTQLASDRSSDLDPFLRSERLNNVIGLFGLFGIRTSSVVPGSKVLYTPPSSSISEEFVVLSLANSPEADIVIAPARVVDSTYATYAVLLSDVKLCPRKDSINPRLLSSILTHQSQLSSLLTKVIVVDLPTNTHPSALLVFRIIKSLGLETGLLFSSSSVSGVPKSLWYQLLRQIVSSKIPNLSPLNRFPEVNETTVIDLLNLVKSSSQTSGSSEFSSESKDSNEDQFLSLVRGFGEVAVKDWVPVENPPEVLKGINPTLSKSFVSATSSMNSISCPSNSAPTTFVSSKKRNEFKLTASAEKTLLTELHNTIGTQIHSLLTSILANGSFELEPPSEENDPLFLGSILLLLQVAGFGLNPSSSNDPLCTSIYKSFANDFKSSSGASTSLLASTLARIAKGTFADFFAALETRSGFSPSNNPTLNTLVNILPTHSELRFSESSKGTSTTISEEGHRVELNANSETQYATFGKAMDVGVWEWELECLRDPESDPHSFFGVLKKPYTPSSSSYDTHPHHWVIRSFNGESYNGSNSNNHVGRVGDRPLSTVKSGSIVRLTFDASNGNLSYHNLTTHKNHGVIQTGIPVGEVYPMVGGYCAGTVEFRLLKLTSTLPEYQPNTMAQLTDYFFPSLDLPLGLFDLLFEINSGEFFADFSDGSFVIGLEKFSRYLNHQALSVPQIFAALKIVIRFLIYIGPRFSSLKPSLQETVHSLSHRLIEFTRESAIKQVSNEGTPSDFYQLVVQVGIFASKLIGVPIFIDPEEKKKGEAVSTVLVVESKHPYTNEVSEYTIVEVPGATSYSVVFDEQSSTEYQNDIIRFYKSESLTDHWGAPYSGDEYSRNFPGTQDRLPLEIPASRFICGFNANREINAWGYKITITAHFPEGQEPANISTTPKPIPVSYLILESPHNYPDNFQANVLISYPGCQSYTIKFDPQTITEANYDYCRFYKNESKSEYWGEEKYTGGRNGTTKSFPGVEGKPSLEIKSSKFFFFFFADGSGNDWGYKFTVTPTFEDLEDVAARNITVFNSFIKNFDSVLALDPETAAIDQALISYLETVMASRNLTFENFMAQDWSGFVHSHNDFEKFPVLARIVQNEIAAREELGQVATLQEVKELETAVEETFPYPEQLINLMSMGFEADVAKTVLISESGNLDKAVEYLLNNPPPPPPPPTETTNPPLLSEEEQTAAAIAASLEDAQPPQPAPERQTKSIDSEVSIYLQVKVNIDVIVDVVWVDFEGAEVLYSTLQPNQFHMQGTYASHLWRVYKSPYNEYPKVLLKEFVIKSTSEIHLEEINDINPFSPTPIVESSTSTSTSTTTTEEVNSSAKVFLATAKLCTLLTERYLFIKSFNKVAPKAIDYVDLSQTQTAWSLGGKLISCRSYILSASKKSLNAAAMQSSATSSASAVDIVISRSKAFKHASKGECDTEGQWSVFSQVMKVIHPLDPARVRWDGKLWNTTFAGEFSIDAGGPYRESWTSLSQEIMSLSLPLCVPSPNATGLVGRNRETWILNPSSTSRESQEMFTFFGKLMGMAARTQTFLDIHLSPIIWKLIAREKITWEDYRDIDIIGATQIEKLRAGREEDGITEELFDDCFGDMTFTLASLSGKGNLVELHPKGDQENLTWSNRLQFCDEAVAFRLNELTRMAQWIRDGLATQLPPIILWINLGFQLETMICGNPEVNVDLLKSCTEYAGYAETETLINWFWEIMKEFSNDDRRAFLRFTWGRNRLPLTKASFAQKMKIQTASSNTDRSLPVSHTCFFSIELPRYSSKGIMKDKLNYAIYNCLDIDGDGGGSQAAALGTDF